MGDGTGIRVLAPSPGIIIHVPVAAGSTVGADDELVVLECMKMEIPVPAPRAGTVREVHVASGDRVQEGDLLVLLSREG